MQLPAEHAFGDRLAGVGQLKELAGAFWAYVFDDQRSMNALQGAVQHDVRQLTRNLYEQVAMVGWDTFPLWHTETFWPLLVNLNEIIQRPVQYGEGYIHGYGDRENIFYGQEVPDIWQIPLPDGLHDALIASDGTLSATYSITNGAGLRFRQDTIELDVNPLDVFEVITDPNGQRKLIIWLYMARFDRLWVANRLGTLFDNYRRTSSVYRDSIVTAIQACISGPSELLLRKMLGIAVDEPVANQGEEIVEVIQYPLDQLIVTNLQTVKLPITKQIIVTAGDRMTEGDFFTDSVRFTDFSGGVPTWMDSLWFPKNLTGVEDFELASGMLSMQAELVTQTSGNLVTTKTYLRPASGDAPFWQWLNASTPSLVRIVADHLQLQVANRDVIDPSLLPAQINVLAALVGSTVKQRLSCSKIQRAALIPQTESILQLIRQIMPPWCHHLVEIDDLPSTKSFESNGRVTYAGLSAIR